MEAVRNMDLVWTPVHALNASAIALQRFDRFGVRLQPGSRLLAARDFVENSIGVGPIDPVTGANFFRQLTASHRDCLEFYLISTMLGEVATLSANRISAAMGGHPLRADDSTTTSRDIQFELLVAALVHHAGIRDVSFEEPDIRIRAGSRYVGVAAKRISSKSQVLKRVRKAAKQIRQNDDYGIIALNLDSIAEEAHLTRGSASVDATIKDTVDATVSFVKALAYGEYVAGIQGFATILVGGSPAETARLGIRVAVAGHWFAPPEDQEQMISWLSRRGQHLQRRIGHLITALL